MALEGHRSWPLIGLNIATRSLCAGCAFVSLTMCSGMDATRAGRAGAAGMGSVPAALHKAGERGAGR